MRPHPLPQSILIGETMVQLDVNFVGTLFNIITLTERVRDIAREENLWFSAVETRLC